MLQQEQAGYLQELASYRRDDTTRQDRYVVERLRDLLDADTRLVLDSGNHSTLGHIRMWQEADFGGRCVGVNFGEQHFSHVATAFCVFGAEVTATADVRPALEEAVEVVRGGGCAAVDVHVSDEMAAGPLVPWWPRRSA